MKMIKSKDNKLVKLIIKLNRSSKERKENSLFVIEGKRLVLDAVKSGADIRYLCMGYTFYNENKDEIADIFEKADECVIFDDSVFNHVCDTKNPQGILALTKTLDKNTAFDKMKCNRKYILLDNLRNPDNMGAIIRTADAFSLDALVLSPGCCDIYSPKVVRGSMGGIFRIPVISVNNAASFVSGFDGITYAAMLDKSALSVKEADFTGNTLVCIGNEGNGVTKEVANACRHKLYIPISDKTESLNAGIAAGVIMWEMTK